MAEERLQSARERAREEEKEREDELQEEQVVVEGERGDHRSAHNNGRMTRKLSFLLDFCQAPDHRDRLRIRNGGGGGEEVGGLSCELKYRVQVMTDLQGQLPRRGDNECFYLPGLRV